MFGLLSNLGFEPMTSRARLTDRETDKVNMCGPSQQVRKLKSGIELGVELKSYLGENELEYSISFWNFLWQYLPQQRDEAPVTLEHMHGSLMRWGRFPVIHSREDEIIILAFQRLAPILFMVVDGYVCAE